MARKSKKLVELETWADFVLKDSFDSRYHVYKKNVFNNGIGIGYIGSCEIENNKYLFQGKKFDTPEELCEAFKEYANTLPFPIDLFDQATTQSSQLVHIFDYYLKTVLGFSDLISNSYYLDKGFGYCRTIGETKLKIHVLSNTGVNSSADNKITIFYNYHNFSIQSDPIKDYREGINFINAYILAMVGETFSEFDLLSNKIMEIKGAMMPNAEGIDQSSSIFDVKKIDAKKMMKEQLLKILESFDD